MGENDLATPERAFATLHREAERLDRFRTADPDPVRNTMALILAGGRGMRLNPLTEYQCKPAMPFGGSFRIIDFSLSNCVNSGIRRISILTQYKSRTLLDHLHSGWNVFNRDMNEFIELMPPQQRNDRAWYQGTADAVYQNLADIEAHAPELVLVLAGDHVYKADYKRLIEYHIACHADVTISTVEVERSKAGQFGIVDVDDTGRLHSFIEKPDPNAESLSRSGDRLLASMGVYVFNRRLLVETLLKDSRNPHSTHDFGIDVLPSLVADHRVQAYPYSRAQSERYWRDVGTLDGYYEANLDLLKEPPLIDLLDDAWPIRTHQPQLPPARFVHDDALRCGVASNSIVASGCVVAGARVRQSLLFSKVRVGERSTIEKSLLLPNVQVGQGCHIRNAIVQQDTVVPPGTCIGFDDARDRKRFHITEGGRTVVCANHFSR